MAKKQIRLKAKIKGDRAEVTCLIKHPMETGNRKDADGKPIAIHYIKYITFAVNGEVVSTANVGPGVSVDPLVTVEILGVKAGDMISVKWEDNKGESGEAERAAK